MQHSQKSEYPGKTNLNGHRERLVELIDRWTKGKEEWLSPIADLLLFRRESPSEPCTCNVEPSLVMVVQGAKQLLIGERAYAYDPDHLLINSLDVPARSQVLNASSDQPCLGLGLRLDMRVMAELIAQNNLHAPRQRITEGCSALCPLNTDLLEPFTRLLALLDEPPAIPVLAPLIVREIHYRLLVTSQATRLWHIASVGSHGQRISKAIEWLRTHYNQVLDVAELAAYVQMSSSNLHLHFRQLTAMSPLQYQKWLRLHEARHLMLNARLDAASAAFQVGYQSPSQFSREYTRLFGAPPKRDVQVLRTQARAIELSV